MFHVYDRNFKRVATLSNEAPDGIHYYDDVLTTTISDGLYTLDLKVNKNDSRAKYLKVGNYVETYTRQGKQLLLTIMSTIEPNVTNTVYCEDSCVQVLNGFVSAIEPPISPQSVEYYLKQALESTPYSIGKINAEDNDLKIIEFNQAERVLARVRKIAEAFNLELDFETTFTPGEAPKRKLNLLKYRTEDDDGFYISSDGLLGGIERNVNIYNLATASLVFGAQKEKESSDERSSTKEKASSLGKKALRNARNIAAKKLPYVWGGNGPNGYDCSGYVQACYEKAGVKINHRATTYTMWAEQYPFKRITKSELRPGDIIMYDTGYTSRVPNHCGIYTGGGLGSADSVIHAGDPVGITQRANSMTVIGYVRVVP